MDINYAIGILEDNNQAINHSFIDYLHERGQFNEQAFWEYHDCLVTFSKKKESMHKKDIVNKIIHTHTYVLMSFIYHFNKNGQYQIENIQEEYYTYLDKIKDAFECCLFED